MIRTIQDVLIQDLNPLSDNGEKVYVTFTRWRAGGSRVCSSRKKLFINSVRQVRIDGHTVVPTIVLYKDGKCFAGFDALDHCNRLANIREDFKVEIGNDDPTKLAQPRPGSDAASGRSTLGIAKDFIDTVVAHALLSIERQGLKRPSQGASPPSIDVYQFEGAEDYAPEFVFLFDIARGIGLPLFPFVVRGLDDARNYQMDPDFFLYDIARGDREIAFKAVQERNEIVLSENGELQELLSATAAL